MFRYISHMVPETSDEADIRALVARQFSSMSWALGEQPDWQTFCGDFLPDARLFPSARPVEARTVDQFVGRMSGLLGSSLKTFQEDVVGTRIIVFGNVAVASVVCENTENGTERNRNVEMLLLVKTAGRWKIAAQAWDKESSLHPIAPTLLSSD
jgi:hypothetical protein